MCSSDLEKEFLSKGVSSRKVELDKVVEPSLPGPSLPKTESSVAPETVPVTGSPSEVGANDKDHETPKEKTTAPRRSSRTHNAPDFYIPTMSVMVVEDYDQANVGKECADVFTDGTAHETFQQPQ